ncbi:hypothetical protein MUN88_14335 [Gracilibacillus caseinilyticus]|uniref:Uncharacterized protein n=1 Tax=Gracilibacillus caseinilyticus TaxID=2932256 RepID=A0ABY4ES40_9BACI|nr:hypothetical protein [Gracilibacillus caseinilyticus]UOQ47244.1 hypothetical protein MUN88_14335 [Gracilibacillus caseinilyticus]
MDSGRKYKYWSLACLVVCLLLWLPNLCISKSSAFWLLTYIVGPLGIYFALKNKNLILITLNALMSVSFFLFLALDYYFAGP